MAELKPFEYSLEYVDLDEEVPSVKRPTLGQNQRNQGGAGNVGGASTTGAKVMSGTGVDTTSPSYIGPAINTIKDSLNPNKQAYLGASLFDDKTQAGIDQAKAGTVGTTSLSYIGPKTSLTDRVASSVADVVKPVATLGKSVVNAPEAVGKVLSDYQVEIPQTNIRQEGTGMLEGGLNLLGKTVPFFQSMQQTPTKVATESENKLGYGLRPDGSKKDSGFLGEVKLPGGGVATEYSVQSGAVVDPSGRQIDFPTLVPTLTQEEVELMRTDIIPNGKPVPESIMQKAIKHANERIKAGQSPFYSSTTLTENKKPTTSPEQQAEINRLGQFSRNSGASFYVNTPEGWVNAAGNEPYVKQVPVQKLAGIQRVPKTEMKWDEQKGWYEDTVYEDKPVYNTTYENRMYGAATLGDIAKMEGKGGTNNSTVDLIKTKTQDEMKALEEINKIISKPDTPPSAYAAIPTLQKRAGMTTEESRLFNSTQPSPDGDGTLQDYLQREYDRIKRIQEDQDKKVGSTVQTLGQSE